MPDHTIVIGSTDGGRTWAFEHLPVSPYALRSISCVSDTRCEAGGADAGDGPDIFSTTDGSNWTQQALPVAQGGMAAVACLSPTTCVAVSGGSGLTTEDAGATWSQTPVPAVPDVPQATACPTATHCIALANDALGRPESLVSDDHGKTWAVHELRPAFGRIWDVACPALDHCVAVSQGTPAKPQGIVSHVLVSDDGGISWTQGTLDDKHGVLDKVTCPTIDTCMAVGFAGGSNVWIKASIDGGQTWTSVPTPPGAEELGGLSCASPTSCVLVAAPFNEPDASFTTSDLGATWQSHPMPGGDDGYFDLACSATTCVAGGESVGTGLLAFSNDSGATWKPAKASVSVQEVAKLTCSTGSICIASSYSFGQPSGAYILSTTDAGRHWSAARVPAGNEMPVDLACFQAACIASDMTRTGAPAMFAGRAVGNG